MDIVIDKLKICYRVKEDSILHVLREKPELEIDWERIGFRLVLVEGTHFDFVYQIIYLDYSDNEFSEFEYQIMGTVSMGLKSDKDKEMKNLAWLRLDNRQFYLKYNHETVNRTVYLDYIADVLGLEFNNVTSLDLAVDGGMNFSKRLIQLIRNDSYIPIVNGVRVMDRKTIVEEILYMGIGSLDRIREYNVYIQQKKAKKDKSAGLTMAAYNKLRELDSHSPKDYIKQLYKYPKRLYRLEVRINSESMKAFFNNEHVCFQSDLLYNKDFLWLVFLTFVNRVIRFQKVVGRKTIGVMDLI